MEILYYLIAFGIIMLFLWINNSNNRKTGRAGEQIVKNILSNLDDDYVVLNNVKYNGAQIDHLIVNHNHKIVFVIETKLWGGIITGNKDDHIWKQVLNGNTKYMDNPLLQNQYHCRIVRKYYHGYLVYNIVVFVNNKNVPYHKCIIYQNNLLDYIKKTTNNISNSHIIGIESGWLSYMPKHK